MSSIQSADSTISLQVFQGTEYQTLQREMHEDAPGSLALRVDACYKTMIIQFMTEQNQRLAELQNVVLKQSEQFDEQNQRIAELQKKVFEQDQRVGDEGPRQIVEQDQRLAKNTHQRVEILIRESKTFKGELYRISGLKI